MTIPQAGSLLGTHRTSTHGIAPGYRPGASMVSGIRPKLQLDLGREAVLIALGDDPTASLQALRDDLDTILKGNT